MEQSSGSELPGITYELIRNLLAGYESHMNIVVHTADCYYLELPVAQARISRFFAAVQRKESCTVLKLNWLLCHNGTCSPLPDSLLKLWDGNFSFVFNTPPNDVLPQLRTLLEHALLRSYQSPG